MIPVPLDPSDAKLCDAVLVTHEHIYHIHPPSYAPLVEDLGATLYAPSAAFEEPNYDGDLHAPQEQRSIVGEGEVFEIDDITIHVRGANDPDAIEPVSYVVEHESGTFFHAGDSRSADMFRDIGDEFDIDVGVLTFGSVGTIYHPEEGRARATEWYNDENQVVEAANDLELMRLVPSHHDMWKGVGADPKGLHEHAASFPYPRTIEPVQIAARIDVGRPGIVPLQALEQ